MLINQMAYAPYSLNHPTNLLTESDVKFSIVYLPWYIGTSDITLIICMSIIFLFIVV